MTELRYGLVSADAHIAEPPSLFESLPPSLRSRAPRVETEDGSSMWTFSGDLEPVPVSPTGARVAVDDLPPGWSDPTERLRMQDGDSLDAEVLYPSSGLWDALAQSDDTEVRLSCVRAYNDWIAAFCKASPERLVGLGKIPSTGVSDACEELERCVSDLGLRGVLLEAWPSGASVAGHHDDEPFWAKVNELDVPVSVHWAFGAGATTTPSTGIAPGLKPPMADAMLPMVAAGVFDRYPNVKIVYAHGDAGWALHWMEFLDSNFVRHKHLDEYALGDPDAVPSEYIRKFSWFTIRQDRSAVKNRRRFGPAHLMWASHVPLADSNWPDSRQQAMRVTDEVPPEDRDALLAGNVARLYRLPGHEKGFTDQEVGNFDTLVHF